MPNPLLSRTAFETALAALESETVSIALTDLDSFTQINTLYGRDGGDLVLQSLERTLLGSLPSEALVARLGGDEYVVALPDYSAESALILLEEIRSHFSSQEISPTIPQKVQLSVGIAAKPPHVKTTSELISAAEEALYRAKKEGRGRVAIYVEDKMTLKSNYYPKAGLERLSKLSRATGRTEASILREALEDVVIKYRDQL